MLVLVSTFEVLQRSYSFLGVDLPAKIREVIRPTADERCHDGDAIATRLSCARASLAVERKLCHLASWERLPARGRGLCLPCAAEASDCRAECRRITRKPCVASPSVICRPQWLSQRQFGVPICSGPCSGKGKSAVDLYQVGVECRCALGVAASGVRAA